MKEVWVTVNDYPDYMVSNLGNVKKLNYRKSGKEKILKPDFYLKFTAFIF